MQRLNNRQYLGLDLYVRPKLITRPILYIDLTTYRSNLNTILEYNINIITGTISGRIIPGVTQNCSLPIIKKLYN